MNLQKLFEAQAILDADIEKHHPKQEGEDRLSKNILALLVELGECANEWRGFKYWSNDQRPRIWVSTGICRTCGGTGTPLGIPEYSGVDCWDCDGEGETTKNPLLEEYVDCLHFILSIGNDLFGEISDEKLHEIISIAEVQEESPDITSTFIVLNGYTADLSFKGNRSYNYEALITIFLNLGLLLGFTYDQIEQAYFDKNKINHQRQETGY